MTCVIGGASRCVAMEVFGRRPAAGLLSAAFPCCGGERPCRQRKECGFPWGPIAALHASGFNRGAGAALCVLSAAAAALGAVPATAAPHRRHTGPRWTASTRRPSRATEAYNKADETRRRRCAGRSSDAQDRIARQQQRINTMRESLGSLAGAQYRSGGIDPTLALLFSDDPADYLDKASALDRITAHQAGELRDLQAAMRELAQERAEAVGKLAELEQEPQGRRRPQEDRREETRQGAPAAQLPSVRRARRLRPGLPRPAAATSPTSAARPRPRPARPPRSPPPAPRSATPYIWGANGPSGFDCSGLMQWSYAQAGVHLPRTSQEQRYAGRQIPLSQAQPR